KKKFAPEPKSKRDLGSGAKFLFFFWFTIDPEKSAVFFLSPKGLRKKNSKILFNFFFAPEPKSNKDLEKLRQKKNFAPEPKSKKDLGSGAKFLFFFLVHHRPRFRFLLFNTLTLVGLFLKLRGIKSGLSEGVVTCGGGVCGARGGGGGGGGGRGGGWRGGWWWRRRVCVPAGGGWPAR